MSRRRTVIAVLAVVASACNGNPSANGHGGSGDGTTGTQTTTSEDFGTSTSSSDSNSDDSGLGGTTDEIRFDVMRGEGGDGPPEIPPGTEPYGPCFEVLYDPDLWPKDVCPGADGCAHWGDPHPDNCWLVGKCTYGCGVDEDCPVPSTGSALVECIAQTCRLFCDGCLPCPDGMICADSIILPDDRPECVWLEAPPQGLECTPATPETVPGPCPDRPE